MFDVREEEGSGVGVEGSGCDIVAADGAGDCVVVEVDRVVLLDVLRPRTAATGGLVVLWTKSVEGLDGDEGEEIYRGIVETNRWKGTIVVDKILETRVIGVTVSESHQRSELLQTPLRLCVF
jgi:hypothetical protein